MTIELGVLLTLAGFLVGGGISWGLSQGTLKSLVTSVAKIERMLGNGDPGVFVRREELKLLRENAERDHDEFRERFNKLEARE